MNQPAESSPLEAHWPGPIGPDEAVVPLWPTIRPQIFDSISGLQWFTISVVSWGTNSNKSENPTTILIGAPRNTEKAWETLTGKIEAILDHVGLDGIGVTIIPAKHPFSALDDPAENILSTSAFQSDIEPGSSLAPKGVDTSATAGGCIRLRNQDSRTEDMIMSVFHCYRTVIGTEHELNGLRLDQASQIETVIPSDQDRTQKLQSIQITLQTAIAPLQNLQERFEWTGDLRLQKWIDDWTREIEEQEAQKRIINEFDSRVGSLRACSGFQIQNLHDWSLSAVTNRCSKLNTLPPPTDPQLVPPTTNDDLDSSTKRYYQPVDGEIKSWSARGPKFGDRVFKRGRTTGVTTGIISHLKTDIVLSNSQGQKIIFTGWEITPEPRPQPARPQPAGRDQSFVQASDSGAWVLDMDGNWRGMVFARLSSGSGVMEDVEVIKQDIERMTGCNVELP
ncbi:hypothetical protein LTR84_008131 [Exophiala bonariae]|uniref:Uncharacterized protein n=1 Tax=Exophiala bonariae TaxID=1690606 RepID=A0AAV9NQY0_9EURO|nr:hypothetical protein LTR84_008131 [Exophiala bonariae]